MTPEQVRAAFAAHLSDAAPDAPPECAEPGCPRLGIYVATYATASGIEQWYWCDVHDPDPDDVGDA